MGNVAKRINLPVTIRLLSDTVFSSGFSIPGGEDTAIKLGTDGQPEFSGSTMKGLFRESLINYLCWTGKANEEATVAALLGEHHGVENDRRMIFGSFRPEAHYNEASEFSSFRAFTAMENGKAKDGSLRVVACLHRGMRFVGIVHCNKKDETLVREVFSCIKNAGLMRNRGFGQIEISCGKAVEADNASDPITGTHLHYVLRTLTPLAIPYEKQLAEDVNFTGTISYIPGSILRGMVISALANRPDFGKNKAALLTKVRFSNALPQKNGIGLIPTPKGFYGDKAGVNFYSILNQDVVPGHKRVPISQFCSIDEGVIYSYSPTLTASLRINRAQKDVFTTTAIAPGVVFEGYIESDDPELMQLISGCFGAQISIGADRYAGNGLCEVLTLDTQEHHWKKYGVTDEEIGTELYLLLISPCAVKENGDCVRVDPAILARKLGVESVTITRCSTSVGEYSGFNRIYNCPGDLEPMYAPGSIFHLHCSSAPTAEALRSFEAEGLGIRREEGFGQILFLKFYDKWIRKSEDPADTAAIPKTVGDRMLRDHWLLTHDCPVGMSCSQIGQVQAICERILSGDRSIDDLEKFFQHNLKDRTARHAARFETMYKILKNIWDGTEQIPGCTDEASRLMLIIDWLNLSRKEAR